MSFLFWSLSQAIIFLKQSNVFPCVFTFKLVLCFLFWWLGVFFNDNILYIKKKWRENFIVQGNVLDVLINIPWDKLLLIMVPITFINKYSRENFTFIEILLCNDLVFSFPILCKGFIMMYLFRAGCIHEWQKKFLQWILNLHCYILMLLLLSNLNDPGYTIHAYF